MKKMLFVMNPFSGQKKANRVLTELLTMFNRADYEVQVHITAGPGDATREVARVCREKDLIVCCGGDGTHSRTRCNAPRRSRKRLARPGGERCEELACVFPPLSFQKRRTWPRGGAVGIRRV